MTTRINLYRALDWARGAHPDLGLTALPPLNLSGYPPRAVPLGKRTPPATSVGK